MLARIARRIIETSGEQFTDSPDMIRNPKRHGWSLADGFMHSAKIVMHDVQANGCNVMIQLLAETVGQPRKPPLLHAERQILPLDYGQGRA